MIDDGPRRERREIARPIKTTIQVRSPAISAGARGPGAQRAPHQRDLAYVIAVVRDHLPEHGLEGSGDLLVAFMRAIDLALQLLRRRLGQLQELAQQLRRPSPQPISLPLIERRRRGRKAFRVVFRIGRALAPDAT